MKKKLSLIVITLIFLIALLTRTLYLGSIPVSMTIDEVGFGYNAYSLLLTGRDEFGKFLPLVFRSIGDSKPPLLIYLTVPFVWLFGLNEFSTRLPVALSGFLTVILVYFLVKRLIKNQTVAIFAALSLAISPWHIRYSHATFEAILALLMMLLGVYGFIYATQNKGKYLWASSIFFALSLYTYNVERLFTPLLALALFVCFYKTIILYKKELIRAIIVGVLITLPLVPTFFIEHGSGARAAMVFITNDFDISRFLYKEGAEPSFPLSLIDSNNVLLFNFWALRYLEYFDLRFLFINGMGLSVPNSPDIGLMYLFELPFFLLGLYAVIFRKIIDPQIKKLLLIWLLLLSKA